MRDDLLEYYERELAFLRKEGAEFAKRYPKIASRLQLEASKCDDPHVERLLEGFAFLAARVHLKVDDDFPEISEALLNIIYPHYTRPIPSMAVVQFQLDPEQAQLTSGLDIPADSELLSPPVGGVPCRFSTCYETTLWPVTVRQARWESPRGLPPQVQAKDAAGVLRIRLECLPDVSLEKLELDRLRFFLSGEGNLVAAIYELLLNHCLRVAVRDPEGKTVVTLPPDALRPVGFGEDEGVLSFTRRSFLGYRLIQEYFTFPEKFFFLDLSGLEVLRESGFTSGADLIFLISSFERSDWAEVLQNDVSEDTFRLGCTPIINLFRKESEPIRLTQKRSEYPVIADAYRPAQTAICSVDDVVATTPGSSRVIRFEPFYSYRHGGDGAEPERFWYARRRLTPWREDKQSDVVISFVDLSGRVVHPEFDAVTARLTCYNADLPSRLPFGMRAGDFNLREGEFVGRIVTLVRPTPVRQAPLGRSQLWRLISQMSLNYLSLVDDGVEALQEILRLHNVGDSVAGENQILGIESLRSTPAYARIEGEHGLAFARGRKVEIGMDEDRFTGASAYLFASVLERFLGLYASMNTFCTLEARAKQRKRVLGNWPPRSGWTALI